MSLRRAIVLSAALVTAAGALAPFSAPLGACSAHAHVHRGAQPDSAMIRHLMALKESMERSKSALKQYEWIETTTITVKDETKGHLVHRCYYGEDGKVQKVALDAPPEDRPARGIRGRIKAMKKEELTDYMKRATELCKSYLPPEPERLRAAKDEGKVSLRLDEPGKRVTIEIAGYELPGDTLALSMDIQANRLLGAEVKTYLDDALSPGAKPKDPVTMKATQGTLESGVAYTETVELDAPSKHLKVLIENSGYRKTGG